MLQRKSGYQSFLMRLWQERVAGRLVWRASLHSTATGETQVFTSLESLLLFLTNQFPEEEEPSDWVDD